MGKTNGFQVIERAKIINENTVVIAAKGYLDEGHRRLAIALGASDYLLKTFSRTGLHHRINKQFRDHNENLCLFEKKTQYRRQDVLQFVKRSVCSQKYLQLQTGQK